VLKKVIISGATGMLGLALIDECLRRHAEVTVILRQNSAKKALLPQTPALRVVECDLCDMGRREGLPDGPYDVFYHFAWERTDNQSRDLVSCHYGNAGYALDALRWAQRSGVRRFVGAGSQAEYGLADGVISPDRKVAPVTAYGVAKYAAGSLGAILAGQSSMEYIWARVFSTYGIHDMSSTMVMYCVDTLLRGEKPLLTKCEQMWDYLNCRDAAAAFYLLGIKGKDQEVYNIGGGAARPLREYVEAIRDAVDKGLPLGIGERPYSAKQVMYLCADIENLTRDTGFRPSVSFEEGIAETIAWRRAEFKGSQANEIKGF
jgi:nucleoside-diphosphate-sugar epimerase